MKGSSEDQLKTPCKLSPLGAFTGNWTDRVKCLHPEGVIGTRLIDVRQSGCLPLWLAETVQAHFWEQHDKYDRVDLHQFEIHMWFGLAQHDSSDAHYTSGLFFWVPFT